MEYSRDKLVDLIQEMLEETTDANMQAKLEKLLVINEKKEKRLNRIVIQNDRNQLEKINKTKELYELSENLEKRVDEEILKTKAKDEMLIKQSKFASMGEMMDAVAHQWKQPISIISMQVDMLSDDYKNNLVDDSYIKEFTSDIQQQIKHTFTTLQEFRSFFRCSKNTKEFNIKETIKKALILVKDEFLSHSITVEVDDLDSFTIDGVENEFIHLILNIINNAKDALNENNISNKTIKIKLSTLDGKNSIELSDNAGGIEPNIIDNIFKANFTTKKDGKGTGIGLYMSYQIAHKHNGSLSAININNGAKFIFEQYSQAL